MVQPQHRNVRRWIDDHFAGRIREQDAKKLWEHVPSCESCGRYVEQQLLLAEIDPAALSAKERIAKGLGLQIETAQRRPNRLLQLGLASALATACAVLLLVVWLRPPDHGFEPRGGGGGVEAPRPSFRVFRIEGKRSAAVKESISADDELAFAYINTRQHERLMICGVDEKKRVYWFAPVWDDPHKNPAAIRIEKGPGLHELPHAVRHDFQGKTLHIIALFTNRQLRVREVERRLKGGRDALRLPETTIERLDLRVTK